MQDSEKLSKEDIIAVYQEDAIKLLKYYNWMMRESGKETSDIYKGEGIEESSVPVPVYDSTLLNFVKDAKTTEFINRNYVYTFSKYSIRTVADELEMIERCSLQEVRILGDILSKYILRGSVKGSYWADGVRNGIFKAILLKLKELLDIRKPLA